MAMFKSRCLRPDARARKCFFCHYHGKCFEEKTQESKFEDENIELNEVLLGKSPYEVPNWYSSYAMCCSLTKSLSKTWKRKSKRTFAVKASERSSLVTQEQKHKSRKPLESRGWA